MNVLRRLFGGSADPIKKEVTDEFGVRRMSDRDLAHQLALGKDLMAHSRAVTKVLDLHIEPEKRERWRKHLTQVDNDASRKVNAIEAELSRRAKNG